MSSKILKLFAKKVKNLRLEKGISQEDFADMCNLDRTYIGRLERMERNPSLETLYKISKGLNLELKELLDFSSYK